MSARQQAERERLHEAVVEVVIERGYEAATVAEIAARAGLDEAAFARHFADLREAMLETYWFHTNRFNVQVQDAYASGESWRESLRGAAYACADYMRDNPKPVRFGTLMMFEAGAMAQTERETHLHQMVDLIDAGRQEMDDPDSVDRSVAEGVLGAIYESVIRALRSRADTRTAAERVPELMYIAVRPYLGQEAAREELSMPPAGVGGAGDG